MANIIDRTRPEQVDLKPLEIPGMGRPEDSRLKFNKVTHPVFPCVRTYCTNCGKPYGWTSDDCYDYIEAAEVIVFCKDCTDTISAKVGKIPMQAAVVCAICNQGEEDKRHDPDGGQFLHPFTFPIPVGALPSKLGGE